MNELRHRLYLALEPTRQGKSGLSVLNRLIIVVIVLSVAFAVLESEPSIHHLAPRLFADLEFGFGLFFLVEYVARLWVAPEIPGYSGGVRGRLRYAMTPAALLDLLAVAPLFITAVTGEAYVLRTLRLVRVLRLAKLGRFTTASRALSAAVHARRYELLVSIAVAGFILVEGHEQPEFFGSIPRSMWWAISTLTTVGYGDAVPATLPGRILGGITAVTGIGLIAMPAGILAAAMSDALQARRRAEQRHEDREAHDAGHPP
jgi:voltage-gated potassium channel